MISLQRRPSRGLGDLRTLTGRSDVQIPAYKAYLRISFLELERARRMQEIRTARARFDIIEGRFREIDTEIAEILGTLNGVSPPARPVERARKPPWGCTRPSGVFNFRTDDLRRRTRSVARERSREKVQ